MRSGYAPHRFDRHHSDRSNERLGRLERTTHGGAGHEESGARQSGQRRCLAARSALERQGRDLRGQRERLAARRGAARQHPNHGKPKRARILGPSSGADIQFGGSITPDTSFDLNTFLDLGLSSWRIHVGWPADWCTNADDILIQIGEGLQGAAASMNASVLTRMEAIFAEDEGLPDPTTNPSIAAIIKKFLSVTFMDVTFPTQHTWPLSNKTDATVVVTGDLCVGYPRSLSSDPSTRR